MEDDGLFDQSRTEDEPFDALPPPLSPGQDQEDPFGDGENGEMSKLADVPEAKRKGVKRPQPKLDSNRLISDRGLPALRTLFNDVRFKGKGHEAEDLRLLMKRMENWAHRLFPKLQFEDFIDKVERLGAKKEVQTCLKRIRLDMPLTHDDYTSKEGEQEDVPPEVQIFGDPDPFGGEHLSSSPPRLVHSTPAPGPPASHSDDLSLGFSPPSLPSLTEEQRRRMAENRLKALERRLARQKGQQTESQLTETQPSESKDTESQSIPMEEAMDVASELPQDVSEAPQVEASKEDAPQEKVLQEEEAPQEEVPQEEEVPQDKVLQEEEVPQEEVPQEEVPQEKVLQEEEVPQEEIPQEEFPQEEVSQEEVPPKDTDPVNSSRTQELQQNQPPTPSDKSHVETTMETEKPETVPSPDPEPEATCQEEGEAKEEE